MFYTFNQNHHYTARAANNYELDFPPTQTTHFSTYSFRKKVAKAWNEIQRMSITDLLKCEFTTFKKKYYDFATTNIIPNTFTNVKITCI